MASQTVTFETGHEEMIQDAQLDYYGKRLATASSDRTIRVFDVSEDKQIPTAQLKGHDGPVWQCVWAHPKFGSLLASCSYDGRIIVWKEQTRNNWMKVFEDSIHEASVNSICWAPHTLGLILAAGAADGTVSVYEHKDNNTWERRSWLAHAGGVCAVSWAPAMKTGALLASGQQVQAQAAPRFASAGCDNALRIWRMEADGKWLEQPVFADADSSNSNSNSSSSNSSGSGSDANKHKDWIRDVAWAPSLGLPSSTIATASEDKTVGIWTEDSQGMFKRTKTLTFDQKVWRVSWSVMGNILAVSQGDNQVSLWKESVDGDWKNLQKQV